MKYIRTYGDYNSWKLDYSNPDRGFRLKPTLYRYPYTGYEDAILLELDDPRKHGDSTYMRIYIDSDTNFSFYIGNKPGDTQTTMTCTIDWGDGTVETKTITTDSDGFKLSHNYTGRNFREIELYDVERDYVIEGMYSYSMGIFNYNSLISHPSIVKNVILGNSVASIKVGAFAYCESLTSINIPEGVTIIGGDVIEGVNGVGGGVFKGCTSLKSINIPESVTSIGYMMFKGCTSLTSVYIPKSVSSIGSMTFDYCSSLTSVYIPEGVTSIEWAAFRECKSLTSINIPEGVTSIREQEFEGCTSLKSINIPEGVTSIERNVFNGCTSLTSVYIPNSVNSIEYNAFKECSSLTSIDIPESVTSIEGSVFSGCRNLKTISSLNTTAPTLDINVFASLPTNGTLHIKPGATGYDAWLNVLPSGWKIVESL